MNLTWTITELKLNLIYNWKISRNETSFKTNFAIEVSDGSTKGIGEVAPNIRYGETPPLVLQQFAEFMSGAPSDYLPVENFEQLLNAFSLFNSLRFGIESAYIHYHCKKNNIKVNELLEIEPPAAISTTYTLPIMEPAAIKPFIERYRLQRFSSLKIKINQESGEDMIREVIKTSGQPLMIDANEAWTNPDELLKLLYDLKKANILLVEQPLPGHLKEEYKYLKKKTPFSLIADESVTNAPDWSELSAQFHGINMKLMKAGGYKNGAKILNEAKKRSMKRMIGCMVETTLGISSAMNLCAGIDFIDLDGFFLIDNEPFGLVKEVDGKLYKEL